MLKTISGRESSILALIAQSQNLNLKLQQKLLSSLTGDALLIAKTMLGLESNPSEEIQIAAKSFLDWAKNL